MSDSRFFGDIEAGEHRDLGTVSVSKSEIVEFAERYDPQPFHVDEAAAAESVYGGIIASGWQSAAVCMRAFVDGFLEETACMGSQGVDDLRWRRPVYPDTEYAVEMEVVDTSARDGASYGLAFVAVNMADGDETVLELTARMMIRRDTD